MWQQMRNTTFPTTTHEALKWVMKGKFAFIGEQLDRLSALSLKTKIVAEERVLVVVVVVVVLEKLLAWMTSGIAY